MAGARDLVTNKVMVYTEALNGAAGLFQAAEYVDQESWGRYVRNLDAARRYPGLQAISYSDVLSDNDKQAYIDARRLDTSPDYQVTPLGQRSYYVPSRYVERVKDNGKPLIGFDLSSEPIRKKTMEWARDNGQASITSQLILVPDKDKNVSEPAFIIFVPIYARNAPTSTVGERQAAITGFVSASVRSRELVEQLFAKMLTKDTAVQIFDGKNKDKSSLIYQSESYDQLVKQPDITQDQITIDFGNNEWTLVGYVNNNIATKSQRNQPEMILYTGIAFSFLASGLLLTVMISRARSISNEKSQEVQEAKDGLISLASHQLRTPATSVKQFVGMILEGYVGPITSEQKQMLQKAYNSNERQLEIINQILHVTRADSGRLVLNKERLDIVKLIKQAASEHKQSLQMRNQKLIIHKSKPIFIVADKHYLAMAIDNLLSNASKYSKPKSTIRVKVATSNGQVQISVIDHGIGIAEKDLNRLFQKFSRIDNELSVEAGGNGIGLYLCKQIITLHDGEINIDSEVDKGTTFTISLPWK